MARHGRHSKRLPEIAGVRLPFTLNQLTSTGAAPTTALLSTDGECGRNVVWNWNIPHQHWKQGKVPAWLMHAFCHDEEDNNDNDRDRLSWNHWWHIHKKCTATGHTLVQQITNKQDPIIVYNITPSTLATHVWIRLDLARNEPNLWFTLAEVEFYASNETAGSARLRLTARTAGVAGNSITTTETLTNGSFATATLTGGVDMFDNPAPPDTLDIGGITYTFVTGTLDATGKVLIDSALGGTGTLANLIQAINGGSGAGVVYATGTTANPYVTASLGSGQATVKLTAVDTLTAAEANAITVSATGMNAHGFFYGDTLAEGVDGIYYADPGFSFSSIVSALNQGAQGLEVAISNETAELLLPDLRSGVWDKALATIEVINWASVSSGAITLFGGRIGKIIYDNTGFVSIEVDNQMSRNKPWPAESWSPTCRAQLGDHRCKFDIESMSRVFTISAIVSQTEIRTKDLSAPANYWQNGVIQVLDGVNAGQSVELLFSESIASATGGDPGNTLVKSNAWSELKRKKKRRRKRKFKKTFYNPDDGATITVGSKTYTFVAALVTGDGYVNIAGRPGKGCNGDNQYYTLRHLHDAINLTASGAGSTYSAGTTANTEIRACDVEGHRISFAAKVAGSAGNAYALSSVNCHMKHSNNGFEGGVGTVSATGGAASTSGAYDTLMLAQAMPFPLVVGDRIKIWPGCGKRFIADCRDRFHNTANFRGEPFAPTQAGLVVQ